MDGTDGDSLAAREAEIRRLKHGKLQVWLQEFSNRLKNRLETVASEVHQVVDGMTAVELNLQNAYNSFRHLSTSQFVESRVHEDDETEQSISATPPENVHQPPLATERSENEILLHYKDTVAAAWTAFQQNRENAGFREKIILPFIIGTEDFARDNTCGLGGLRMAYEGQDDPESDGDAYRHGTILTSDFIEAVAPAEDELHTIDTLYFDREDASLEPAVSAALDFKAMLEAALRNPSLPYDGGTDGNIAGGAFGKYDNDEYSLDSANQALSDSPRDISTMVDIIGRTMSTIEESQDEIRSTRSLQPVVETVPQPNVVRDVPFGNLIQDASTASRPELSRPPDVPHGNLHEQASTVIQPEITMLSDVPFRNALDEAVNAIRPKTVGPPEVPFRNHFEEISTAIQSEISEPPDVSFRNLLEDALNAIRPLSSGLNEDLLTKRERIENPLKEAFPPPMQSLLNAELKQYLSSSGDGELVATSRLDRSSSFSGGLFEGEDSDTGSLGRKEAAIPNSSSGPTVPDELFQDSPVSEISWQGVTDSLDASKFSPPLQSTPKTSVAPIGLVEEDHVSNVFDDRTFHKSEGAKTADKNKSLDPIEKSSDFTQVTNALPFRQERSFTYKGLFDDDDDDEDDASSILFGRAAPKADGQSFRLGASSSGKSLLDGLKPNGVEKHSSFSPLFESKDELSGKASSDADSQSLTSLSMSHPLWQSSDETRHDRST